MGTTTDSTTSTTTSTTAKTTTTSTMPDAEHNFETTFEATIEPTTEYPTTIEPEYEYEAEYEPRMMNDFTQFESNEQEEEEEVEYEAESEYETEYEVINYDEETLPDMDNGARDGQIEYEYEIESTTVEPHQMEAMQMDVPINQQVLHQRSSQYGQQPQQEQQQNNQDTHVYQEKADFQCWTCDAKNPAECAQDGFWETCFVGQTCRDEVRWRNGKIRQIIQGCKQRHACNDQKGQNFNGEKPRDHQCSPRRSKGASVCRQCCNGHNDDHSCTQTTGQTLLEKLQDRNYWNN